jgi:uncharacterized cupredoxin-like copper-binding protein
MTRFGRISHGDALTARRRLGIALALMLVGLVVFAACGDDDKNSGGNDAAANLVRNQTASSCEAPPMPAGTPVPDGTDPLSVTATPTAEPPLAKSVGAPSKAEAEEVTAAIRNFVNCWNQRKFESVATLATPSFLKQIFMQIRPQDSSIVMHGLPDGVIYDIKSVGDMQEHADGRISTAFDYFFVHQERKGRWYFTKRDGWWMMDREMHVTPEIPGEKIEIEVEGKDYAYVMPDKFASKPVTIMHVRNTGELPHDFLIVRIKEGVDVTRLLQPDLRKPEGVEFIGQITLEPNEREDMVMKDVQPGQYIFICQFRYPGGQRHTTKGMLKFFTVE